MLHIVGAGPVGLLSAILSSRRGRPFRLFERKTAPEWICHDRRKALGITLSGRGLGVLERAGLGIAGDRRFQPVVGRAIHLADGAVATMNYGTDGAAVLHSVTREDLMAFLHERFVSRTGGKIEFGRELAAIDEAGTKAVYRDPEHGHSFDEGFSGLIACDGWRSTAFRALEQKRLWEARTRELPWSYTTFVARARPSRPDSLARIRIVPRQSWFAVGIPHADATVSFTVAYRGAASAQSKLDTLKAALAEIARIPDLACEGLPNDSAEGLAALVSSARPFRTSLAAPRSPSPTVQLIGDSRHQLVHLLGQGLNLGFAEAEAVFAPEGGALARIDANARIISRIAEKQIGLMRSGLGSGSRRRLYALRQAASRRFPRLFYNEYEAISGDETRLSRTRLRLLLQRTLEVCLAFPLLALFTRERTTSQHA